MNRNNVTTKSVFNLLCFNNILCVITKDEKRNYGSIKDIYILINYMITCPAFDLNNKHNYNSSFRFITAIFEICSFSFKTQ